MCPEREREREREGMGEAKIGLSDQASKRDTVMAATKTGCLDVIKNSQRDHPGRPAKQNGSFQQYQNLPHS